jgi:hypothetical protein
MKKLFVLFALIVAALSINAQCTIISAFQTIPGISPAPAALPCVVDSAPFDQTIQVQCPTSYDTSVNVVLINYPVAVVIDSIELDSVINLPAGLTWTKNPNRLAGGQNGCLTFSGATTAAPGIYNLTWYGTAWATPGAVGPISGGGQRTVVGSLNRYGYVSYYLNVIGNATDPCGTTGINTIDPALNAELSVYPNPSNGVFSVKLNAGSRVSGLLEVVDVTGRIVFAQDVDLIGRQNVSVDLGHCAKGIYTVLLRTANGNATKRISID